MEYDVGSRFLRDLFDAVSISIFKYPNLYMRLRPFFLHQPFHLSENNQPFVEDEDEIFRKPFIVPCR